MEVDGMAFWETTEPSKGFSHDLGSTPLRRPLVSVETGWVTEKPDDPKETENMKQRIRCGFEAKRRNQ